MMPAQWAIMISTMELTDSTMCYIMLIFPFYAPIMILSETILKGKTKPYHIIEKQGIKIGIFGIGIELDGLVDSRLYGNTIYNDPIESANKYAQLLKERTCMQLGNLFVSFRI